MRSSASPLASGDLSECCSSGVTGQDSLNTSSWGLHRASSSCLTGCTGAVSADDALSCQENLFAEEDSGFCRDATPQSCSPPLLTLSYPSLGLDRDVLRNELLREEQSQPGQAPSMDREVRARAVSWLVEVSSELELQQCTLHLAVTYFDKFLDLSKVVPPGYMLQLLALACVSIAAKQEEVKQRLSQQWLTLARGEDDNILFMKEDLLKMEWLVLETLEWRTRVPTAYTFGQLLLPLLWGSDALSNPQKERVTEVSSFLAELSLLDSRVLEFSYSTVAAASLVLGEYISHAPACLVTKELLNDVLPLESLRDCISVLHNLYQDAERERVLLPVACRHSRAMRA